MNFKVHCESSRGDTHIQGSLCQGCDEQMFPQLEKNVLLSNYLVVAFHLDFPVLEKYNFAIVLDWSGLLVHKYLVV